MWFVKKTRQWEMLNEAEMVKKLTLPEGIIDMVLDTDTYNEIDDQFAISYALRAKEKLDVKALYAAPFFTVRIFVPPLSE